MPLTTTFPNPETQPLMTVDELIPFMSGMGRSAVYEAIRRKELPSVRFGSRIFLPTGELRRILGVPPTPTGPAGASPQAETDQPNPATVRLMWAVRTMNEALGLHADGQSPGQLTRICRDILSRSTTDRPRLRQAVEMMETEFLTTRPG